jgi:hypothetical protein
MAPLTREQLSRVIEGRGCADRVPIMLHFWIHSGAFAPEKAGRVDEILARYPMDAQVIPLNIPAVYRAPEDDPSVPHNAAEIARLTGIAPAALLPFVSDIGARAPRRCDPRSPARSSFRHRERKMDRSRERS